MFKKMILIALIALLAMSTATACSKSEQPAPADSAATEQSPSIPPTTSNNQTEATPSSEKNKSIPEFTVKELFVFIHGENPTVSDYEGHGKAQDLIGKTIRVRGVISSITARRSGSEENPRFTWEIVIQENLEFLGQSDKLQKAMDEVRTERLYVSSKDPNTDFVTDLIKKTSSWEVGDKVILEGKVLNHLTQREALPAFVGRGGMIELEIRKIEKVS